LNEHPEIGKELIQYSYLTSGGNPTATGFNNIIPVTELNEFGKYYNSKEFEQLLNDDSFSDIFFEQFYRNNPTKAYNISELNPIKLEGKNIQVKSEDTLPKYVYMYVKQENAKAITLIFKKNPNFKPSDNVYYSLGLLTNEYAGNVTNLESIYPDNNKFISQPIANNFENQNNIIDKLSQKNESKNLIILTDETKKLLKEFDLTSASLWRPKELIALSGLWDSIFKTLNLDKNQSFKTSKAWKSIENAGYFKYNTIQDVILSLENPRFIDFIQYSNTVEPINKLIANTIFTLERENTVFIGKDEKLNSVLPNKNLLKLLPIVPDLERLTVYKSDLTAEPDLTGAKNFIYQNKFENKKELKDKLEINITNNIIGFQGYKGGFDSKGKGTPEGDGKDKAMRKIADGFIGEAKRKDSSTYTSASEISKKTNDEINWASKTHGTIFGGSDMAKITMLARNSEFKGKELNKETKEAINLINNQGGVFVVGDMPNVDSQFIDYLQEIGAKFTIYHTGNTPRIKINQINQELTRNTLTDSGKTIDSLGITQDEWNSLSEEEKEKIKKCN
jgi:hypothetical protein